MRLLRTTAAVTLFCVALAWALAPSPARSHGIPIDIALWGPFGTPTLRCIRILSWATQRCFRSAMSIHRECMSVDLMGGHCDVATRDARIADAIATAQGTVADTCRGGQLLELRFNSLDETKLDVSRACGGQADAAMSMLDRPAFATASSGAAASPTACLVQTAAWSQQLVDLILRLKSRVLNRMAVQLLTPSQKRALIAKVEARTAAARDKLAARIQQTCPDFAVLYQRSIEDLLTELEARADCIIGANYVQDSIACPPIVCGNGVREPGEDCDDGNTVDGDACPANCRTGS